MNAPDTSLTGPVTYASEQDEFCWHELMDRCFMLTEILGTTIEQHPCGKLDPGIQKAIDNARDALWNLYQTAADVRYEKFPEKE